MNTEDYIHRVRMNQDIHRIKMKQERWEYLKALQPSPGRLFWNSERLGTYRNPDPAKNQKRKTKRAIGARRFKRITKVLNRARVDQTFLNQLAAYSQLHGDYNQ